MVEKLWTAFLLIAIATGPGARADSAEEADCDLWTLDGYQLGMSVDEASPDYSRNLTNEKPPRGKKALQHDVLTTQEAFTCPSLPRHSVCSPTFLESDSWRGSTSTMVARMAAPSC